MSRPDEYKSIATYGRRLGSFWNYIAEQQVLAAKENAPLTATWRDHDGTWHTTDEIRDPAERTFYNLEPLDLQPERYESLSKWAKMLGSSDGAIRLKQERAAIADAPLDAIYQNEQGRWVRLGDVRNMHFRERIKNILDEA